MPKIQKSVRELNVRKSTKTKNRFSVVGCRRVKDWVGRAGLVLGGRGGWVDILTVCSLFSNIEMIDVISGCVSLYGKSKV